MSIDSRRAIEVFCSYAHKDEKWRNELEKQLSNLKRQGLITTWHDRKISAGMDWAREIDAHLNTASIILLLISPDFMASDYCYGVEMNQAIERFEAGESSVIPILLRPTDLQGTPFSKLQSLPVDGKPVTSWRNHDKAFLEIARGIRKTVEELCFTNVEDIAILRQQYCDVWYERWKMLDFRGIMHVEMNRPMSIPLLEVFVCPDVLIGLPEYETLEREEEYNRNEVKGKRSNKYREDEQERIIFQDWRPKKEKRIVLQREELPVVLSKARYLVILGDPGAGKSTLLRYFLLRLTHEKDRVKDDFPQLSDGSITVPLYLALASYAEVWHFSPPGERSLTDFLPKFLRENYPQVSIPFFQKYLERGLVFFLFDGLDEIPDISLRVQVVRQIEVFTQAFPKNHFIVTSRIIGYKEAPLAGGYQPYTLADFSENQIKAFTQKWCPAYERWVEGTIDNRHPKGFFILESERLYQATQRNPGVKRLAINPLLLTILALIQRQGIELPNHRVELYDLCVTTLLDTWVKARGQSINFSRNDLIKILRPLAFWMHQHRTVGAIPEEELIEQIVKQLLERKITRHEDEASRLATQFLETVRGKTGILVERGRHRYGFLHQTFEEYFAARELVINRDRNTFIKQHLHDSRWREVILLTVGIVGILDSNEEGVTELIQEAILEVNSSFEKWLYRDLFFAGLCIADDVGASIVYEDEIIEQIVFIYLTSPFDSLREAFSGMLNTWDGTNVAKKVIELLITPETSEIISDSSKFRKKLMMHHEQFVQYYQESQIAKLRLNILNGLNFLGVGITDWIDYVLTMHSDPLSDVRIAALNVLSQIDDEQPFVIKAFLESFTDPDPDVREVAEDALSQIIERQPRVIKILLKALVDSSPHIQWAAANALEQISYKQTEVVKALLEVISDPDLDLKNAAVNTLRRMGKTESKMIKFLLETSDTIIRQMISEGSDGFELLIDALGSPYKEVRQVATQTLNQLNSELPKITSVLLKVLVSSGADLRVVAVRALGQIGGEQPDVIDSLLKVLADPRESVRVAAVEALGQVGRGQPDVIIALLEALTDPKELVREGAMQTLGQVGRGQPDVIDALLKALADLDFDVRIAAIEALGQVGGEQPEAIKGLLAALADSLELVRVAAIHALGQVGGGQPEVLKTLLRVLTDPRESVRVAAVQVLGQIGRGQPEVIDTLLKVLVDSKGQVRVAIVEALGQVDDGLPKVISVLFEALTDSSPEVRLAAVQSLGQMGSKPQEIISTLLEILKSSDKQLREILAETLEQEGRQQTYISMFLSSIYAHDFLQQIVDEDLAEQYEQNLTKNLVARQMNLLSQIGNGQPEVINAFLEALTNSDSEVREIAAQALGKVGNGHLEVINALLKALTDVDSDVREAAARALGQTGTRQLEILKVLLETLRKPIQQARLAASCALGYIGIGQPEVITILLETLADSDSNVRAAAVRALGQVGGGHSMVINSLLETLADADSSDSNVRAAAVRALGQIGSGQPRVINRLLEALTDSYWSVREAAAFALGQVSSGQPKVINFLLRSFTEDNVELQAVLAESLGRVGGGNPKVIDVLLEKFIAPDPDARQSIASAFSTFRVNRKDVAEHVENLLQRYEALVIRQIIADDTVDFVLLALNNLLV